MQPSTDTDGVTSDARTGLDLSLRLALSGPSGPFDLDVRLAVAAGSFVAIVGPSGAGKTTLLRLLAGLARPDAGHVRVGTSVWCASERGVHLPTHRRPIGFVFQDYALFPNMTVRGNVEYAMGGQRNADWVRKLLQLVELEGLGEAYPARLSGGQKQRLALIRALARRPSLLMLDEPLSALDPALRRQLQDEIKRLHASFGTITLLVSHDIPEILRLADRVVRIDEGKVVFDGTPAAAFGCGGADRGADGGHVLAQHVSGPDESGVATVHIDGRPVQVRYRQYPRELAAGDTVVLRLDEVTVERVA